MPEKIRAKAIIFDFDNTLVNTHQAINYAYSEISKKLADRLNLDQESLKDKMFAAQKEAIDKQPLSNRVYDRRVVIEQVNSNLSLGLTENEINELAESFYDAILNKVTYPEYTENVLEELKNRGKKLGLLTDTDVRPGLKKRRLEKLSFIRLFDAFIIAGETIPQRKTGPIPFIELSRLLGVKPEDTVAVGDRMDADIDNAKEAGMKAILTDAFLQPNTGINEPDAVIHDIKDLLNIIS